MSCVIFNRILKFPHRLPWPGATFPAAPVALRECDVFFFISVRVSLFCG